MSMDFHEFPSIWKHLDSEFGYVAICLYISISIYIYNIVVYIYLFECFLVLISAETARILEI